MSRHREPMRREREMRCPLSAQMGSRKSRSVRPFSAFRVTPTEVAVATFNIVLRLAPDNAMTYNNLGNTLRDLGQDEVALQLFKRGADIGVLFTSFEEHVVFNRCVDIAV